MRIARLLAALLIVLTTLGATPMPVFTPSVPTNYARLCNPRNTSPVSSSELTDEAAIEASATAIAHVTALHVVMRWPLFQTQSADPALERLALLTDGDALNPHWYQAVLGSGTTVTSVVAADAQRIGFVRFVRSISAYEYLNELLQADDAARARCQDAFAHGYPNALASDLRDAVENPGKVTPALAEGVQQAFAHLNVTTPGQPKSTAWTIETVRALGPKPAVELIYRDPGFPGDGGSEIDIVRLGTAPYTYAMVVVKDAQVNIAVTPICVEGDHRCAAAYVWP